MAALLLLAIVPFVEAVWQPGHVPVGLDLVQHYSRESFNRLALQETWVPLWNPYDFSGFPTQADPQAGVFYPPSMLLRLFGVPTFLTWTIVAHVWLFGVGGYVLCRTLGTGRAAAAIGGAALMLGGITMPRVYAGHLDVLRTVTWVPLALATAMRSLDRGSIRPSAAAVATLSLQLLASFLQMAVYTLGVVGLYAAFSAVWPAAGPPTWARTRRVALQFAVLVLLVFGVTAFQVLPTTRLIMAAGRTQGMPYADAAQVSLPVREMPAAMFLPERTGEVSQERWERTTYVGWLPAALAPLGLVLARRRRGVVFLVLVGVLAVGFGTGDPLYKLHYDVFPMFRIPGRLLCFWAIAVAALGAVALDWLARRRAPAARPTHRLTWRSAGVPCVAGLLVIADGIGYARHFVDVRLIDERFASSLPFTPAPHGRVLSLCEALQTSEISALGVPSIDGYNSFFLGGYARMAQRARGEPMVERFTAFPRIAGGRLEDVAVANALNVTDIAACEPLALPGLSPAGERDGLYLYRNTGAFGRVALRCEDDGRPLTELAPPCDDPSAITRIQAADTPTGVLRFRVALPAARTLVLSEPFYPERRAWVDGVETPLEPANMALSAVRVDAGFHLVELRYVPASLMRGALISAAVLVLWASAEVRRRRRRYPGS